MTDQKEQNFLEEGKDVAKSLEKLIVRTAIRDTATDGVKQGKKQLSRIPSFLYPRLLFNVLSKYCMCNPAEEHIWTVLKRILKLVPWRLLDVPESLMQELLQYIAPQSAVQGFLDVVNEKAEIQTRINASKRVRSAEERMNAIQLSYQLKMSQFYGKIPVPKKTIMTAPVIVKRRKRALDSDSESEPEEQEQEQEKEQKQEHERDDAKATTDVSTTELMPFEIYLISKLIHELLYFLRTLRCSSPSLVKTAFTDPSALQARLTEMVSRMRLFSFHNLPEFRDIPLRAVRAEIDFPIIGVHRAQLPLHLRALEGSSVVETMEAESARAFYEFASIRKSESQKLATRKYQASQFSKVVVKQLSNFVRSSLRSAVTEHALLFIGLQQLTWIERSMEETLLDVPETTESLFALLDSVMHISDEAIGLCQTALRCVNFNEGGAVRFLANELFTSHFKNTLPSVDVVQHLQTPNIKTDKFFKARRVRIAKIIGTQEFLQRVETSVLPERKTKIQFPNPIYMSFHWYLCLLKEALKACDQVLKPVTGVLNVLETLHNFWMRNVSTLNPYATERRTSLLVNHSAVKKLSNLNLKTLKRADLDEEEIVSINQAIERVFQFTDEKQNEELASLSAFKEYFERGLQTTVTTESESEKQVVLVFGVIKVAFLAVAFQRAATFVHDRAFHDVKDWNQVDVYISQHEELLDFFITNLLDGYQMMWTCLKSDLSNLMLGIIEREDKAFSEAGSNNNQEMKKLENKVAEKVFLTLRPQERSVCVLDAGQVELFFKSHREFLSSASAKDRAHYHLLSFVMDSSTQIPDFDALTQATRRVLLEVNEQLHPLELQVTEKILQSIPVNAHGSTGGSVSWCLERFVLLHSLFFLLRQLFLRLRERLLPSDPTAKEATKPLKKKPERKEREDKKKAKKK